MLKWKRKEEVVFDIRFHLIVNTVRKIAAAKASWLALSNILYTNIQQRAVPNAELEIVLGIEKSMQIYVTRLLA